MAIALPFIAVLGLLIGSFLNVVIHRVPRGEYVVHPRSRCPGCENEIAPRDNIPVLSWLILRGRCRHRVEADEALLETEGVAAGTVKADEIDKLRSVGKACPRIHCRSGRPLAARQKFVAIGHRG